MTGQSSNGQVSFTGSCPAPLNNHRQITLGHGSGGRMSHELIQKLILPEFKNEFLEPLHDGAIFSINGTKLAFSTDSFVVNPLFFPGGDIGKLAVCGTVNDLAMCGAVPKYLSASLILEEGVAMDDLARVIKSMRETADEAGVSLVTGDTKVVERGKGDKIFINTAGIGVVPDHVRISPREARPGDQVLINGAIAVHGIAIMSVRDHLEFETEIRSDCAPLNTLVAALLEACPEVRVLRDPTRGGVASALNEIAQGSNAGIQIDEASIRMSEEVKGACEILGFDPLYVANEGKMLAIVPREGVDAALKAMRGHPYGREASVIGEVVKSHPGFVTMRTRVGGNRVVDMLAGEQLPRIC